MKHRTKQATTGSRTSDESGFTVIELMVATIVSSLILLACTASIVQVGKMFYKGITAARTQEVSRTVIDEVSRPLQFSGSMPVPNTGTPVISNGVPGAFCIGNVRYSYIKGRQVSANPAAGQTRHALWRDVKGETAPCAPADLNAATPLGGGEGQSLVGNFMRLVKFSVVPVNPAGTLWDVSVKVAYGDDNGTTDGLFTDINSPDTIACKSAFLGSQFCAISELNTAVTRRLR